MASPMGTSTRVSSSTTSKLIVAFALLAGAAALALMATPKSLAAKLADFKSQSVHATLADSTGNVAVANDWTKPFDVTHPGGGVPAIFKKIVSDDLSSMCVLKFDGTVWCWGAQETVAEPNQGKFGATPVQIKYETGTPLNNITDISSQCALRNDGTVWCWGMQVRQDIPLVKQNRQIIPVYTPYAIQMMSSPSAFLTNVVKISSNPTSRCVVKSDHSLWCWRWQDSLYIGSPRQWDLQSPYPIQVVNSFANGPFVDAKDLATDINLNCVIDTHSKVWCWGQNTTLEVGTGVVGSEVPYPAAVRDPVNHQNDFLGVKQVAVAWHTACAIDGTNALACWGLQDDKIGPNVLIVPWPLGQDMPYYMKDQNNVVISNVKKVAVDTYFSCYVKIDGTVWCWGYNFYGNLGNGNHVKSLTIPVQVNIAGQPIFGITDMAVGHGYACAIWMQNQVGCWGGNKINQPIYNLGNGVPMNVAESLVPAVITFP